MAPSIIVIGKGPVLHWDEEIQWSEAPNQNLQFFSQPNGEMFTVVLVCLGKF